MRLFEGLYDGEFGLRGVVDVDATCARGGQQLCGGRRYGEYIASFRMRRVDCMEGKVLFRLQLVNKE